MDPLKNWKLDVNYWDVDPQLSTIEPFLSLFKKDKSKKRVESSQFMWALAFFSLPSSRLRKSTPEERVSIINSDIINIKVTKSDLELHTIKYVKIHVESALERSVMGWSDKLDERNEFLLQTKYKDLDMDDAVKFDKLLAGQGKLIKEYVELISSLDSERSQAKTKASAKRSAGEKKLI